MEKILVSAGMDNIHIRLSGIAYGRNGNTGHVNLREVDFKYVAFVGTSKDSGVTRLLMSQSP